jgi:hypothetical protein
MTGSRQPIVGLVGRAFPTTFASPRRARSKRRGKRSAIVAVAGVEPHAVAVAARQDAKAVVLDLVDPAQTRRRLFRRFWQAGLDGFMREDGSGTWALVTGA